MGSMIFNILVSIVAVSLIIFLILGQKKFSRKLDTVMIIAGAGIIFIVSKPLIWILVFMLAVVYFSFRHKQAQN
ncbi:hypothetical protein JNUCC1_02818 [Lentibacillus sp. JNUCC-1]|uniref:hypothetical protein n=1 Tax=Lentibacillus sp. JNUCC-1 TaxID=2654513 RepID=UPI0012E93249|nr:hypothetical protein [Lentibacillus sp. JNUCC-1]MUV38946.1 hypothetical protein [Lentibacillus sp. JNUCC-1]